MTNDTEWEMDQGPAPRTKNKQGPKKKDVAARAPCYLKEQGVWQVDTWVEGQKITRTFQSQALAEGYQESLKASTKVQASAEMLMSANDWQARLWSLQQLLTTASEEVARGSDDPEEAKGLKMRATALADLAKAQARLADTAAKFALQMKIIGGAEAVRQAAGGDKPLIVAPKAPDEAELYGALLSEIGAKDES